MKFGMPYKGSKNSIAQHIIDVMPPADFHEVGFVNKRSLMDAAGKAGTKKEKLFTNRHEEEFILC